MFELLQERLTVSKKSVTDAKLFSQSYLAIYHSD